MMRPTRIIVALLLLALVAAGAFLFARSRETPKLTRLQLDPGVKHAWPVSDCWTWSFPLPADIQSGGLAVRIREKSEPLTPGAHPMTSQMSKAMPRSDANRELSAGNLISGHAGAEGISSGTVTVQLLDLSQVGVQSTKAGQDLRVLVNLKVGSSVTRLSDHDIYLPAGRFSGKSVHHKGEWTNGEVYLMSFWVEGDDKSFQYDVLVEHTAPRESK